MKKTSTKVIGKKPLLFLLLVIVTLAMSIPAFADCNGAAEKYRQFDVTYYEIDYPAILSFDSRCRYITDGQGRTICRIRLRGTLYLPPSSAYVRPRGAPAATFPAIVINHGSEETFEATEKFCTQANYLVPKGYIVFAPFRRGQGDGNEAAKKSTGIYVEDMLNDFALRPNSVWFHDTQCDNRSCYKAQLLKQQADEEIAAAMEWLKLRSDVKTDPGNSENHRIAIMGISYGGAVTVFANRHSLGQKAAVPFSPGAQQWDPDVNCGPNQDNCGTDFQRSLISAARFADRPAYYLQAKWDYDTRATIDLAYAHAYGSADPKHSRGWNAAIFPYQYPCATNDPRSCTDDDYQSIHAGFFGDIAVWWPTVGNFLRRYDVK
jgi:dienelactone hydrolase